jgi:hypothetical protein
MEVIIISLRDDDQVKRPYMIRGKGADSSAGGASALQAEGHRFKPCSAHHKIFEIVANPILSHRNFREISKKTRPNLITAAGGIPESAGGRINLTFREVSGMTSRRKIFLA